MTPQPIGPWLCDALNDLGPLVLAQEEPLGDRELVTLVLGSAALLMAVRHRQQLSQVPGFGWWFAALLLRATSWVLTVVEEFFAAPTTDVINVFEHLTLMTSTVLVAIGCWALCRPNPEGAG